MQVVPPRLLGNDVECTVIARTADGGSSVVASFHGFDVGPQVRAEIFIKLRLGLSWAERVLVI